MIFGKKSGEAGSASSSNAVVGGKTVDERRGAGSAVSRSQSEDLRPGASPRNSRIADDKTSTLCPHLTFEGNLRFSGKVTIDCEFRGSVVTDDTLIVGPSGRLEAEVTAGVVEVSGKVRGNIKARTRVKIFSRGEVHGNIETPTVSMEEGVLFEGNCTRPPEGRQGEGQGSAQPAAVVRVSMSPKRVLSAMIEPEPAV